MTRRREVPTLAFTVPEAAEAIRLSENTLRIWVREGIVRSIRWQALDLIPRVELDRLILVALDNGGVLPNVALSADPPVLSRDGSADSGAAGPRDTRSALGEVRAATVGPSNEKLPGRSTHAKRAAVGAAALQNNAG